MNMPLVLLNLRRRAGVLVTYSNFIPSGSDSLITADSLTFKSRASAVPTGEWVIVGTVVESAPLFDNPAAPVISGGVLSGPAGIYRIVNADQGTDAEYSLTPPTSLTTWGEPGEAITVYQLVFSSAGPSVDFPLVGFSEAETWSAYANGNTFTELDALYDRTSTALPVAVSTDAAGAAGLGVQWGLSSGAAPRILEKTTIKTELATRIPSEKVQVLGKFRAGSANWRGGFGYTNGTTHSGLMLQQVSGSYTNIHIQTEGDVSTGTNITTLVSTVANNTVFWVKFEVENAVIRAKYWVDGGSEPGSWTTRTHSGDVPFTTMGLVARTSVSSHYCLGYSIGIDVPAPTF